MAGKMKRGGSRHRRFRLYTRRDKDGALRYYADLRSLGGRQIALKPNDDPRARATADRDAERDPTVPFIHALIATFLLTGGRNAEVLGLEVGDINFQRNTVTFRPHVGDLPSRN